MATKKNHDEASRLDALIQVLAKPTRESTGTPWTQEKVRSLFVEYDVPYRAWESHFGFRSGWISRMVNGVQQAARGETHKAAVLLGLKIGSILELDSNRRAKMERVIGGAVKADFASLFKKD